MAMTPITPFEEVVFLVLLFTLAVSEWMRGARRS